MAKSSTLGCAVINYEEGGENCILHGDVVAEAFLSEVIEQSRLLECGT